MNDIPNFLVIGAGKSGTTSLTRYMSQHPDIYIPDVREPNYFIHEWQGSDSIVKTWEEYLAMFDGAQNEKCKGEVSPSYMYYPNVPERIKSSIPDVKLIAILRNPADRLYSRYMQCVVRESKIPSASIEDALTRGNVWWERDDLINEGLYYTHLERFYKLFKQENIKVLLYEDYDKQPEKFFETLFDFLEVDPAFVPDTSIRLNLTGKTKSKFLKELVGVNGIAKRTLKARFPKTFQALRANDSVVKWVNRGREKNLDRPAMREDIRTRILHEIYYDEIIKLQDLIQRDLSPWLADATGKMEEQKDNSVYGQKFGGA